MSLTKKRKILYIILGTIICILVVVILSINYILAGIIEGKITNALDNLPDKNYHITLEDVGVNILNGNVNLKGLQIEPDTAFIEALKNGETDKSMAVRVSVPLFRLAGLNMKNAITEKEIDIRKILFKNAALQLIVGKKKTTKKPAIDQEVDKEFQIDSIQIEGLNGIKLGKFELSNFSFEIINAQSNEIVLDNKDLNLIVAGVNLIKLSGDGDFFRLQAKNGYVELTEENLKLPGGLYQIAMQKMRLDFSDSTMVIEKFKLKPQIEDRFEMARKLKFTEGIFNVAVDEIIVSTIDIRRLINHGELFLDNIAVSGANIEIFKDKRMPWNLDNRPKYPNQALRTMAFPLYIREITVEKSKLKYYEESAKTFGNLDVQLDDMKASLTHITSFKDSTRKPMEANLRARLYNSAAMTVDFLLPLNSPVDTFYVSGSLGNSDMTKFNPALFPALGMKITKGNLNSVTFKARANRRYIDGEMVMMYDGLETEVVKKDAKSENKFMSWLANSVAKKSNPGKNDRLRTASMLFERDMYKGFINIAWKGVQMGLVNTISPAGKIVKDEKKEEKRVDKLEHKEERNDKEKSKKEERIERREKKKQQQKDGN